MAKKQIRSKTIRKKPIGDGAQKTELVRPTQKHLDFVASFVQTYDRTSAMIEAGLNFKRTGEPYTERQVINKANQLLKQDVIKALIREQQKELHAVRFHCVEKAVEESYNYYLELKEIGKHHEANIAYARYTEILGLTGKNAILHLNQNVTLEKDSTNGNVTINYHQPIEDVEYEDLVDTPDGKKGPIYKKNNKWLDPEMKKKIMGEKDDN